MARLKPILAEQKERHAAAVVELKAARAEEAERKIALERCRSEDNRRRVAVVARLQGCVRGWLVRRKFVGVLTIEVQAAGTVVAQLPDQLRENLVAMQHSVHDTAYKDEHRLRAAIRLQSWWRGIQFRRVYHIVWVATRIRRLHEMMEDAATKIQAWFRCFWTKFRYSSQIHNNMLRRHKLMLEEMEMGLLVVIKLQRNVRARLARKRLQEAREKLEAAGIAAAWDSLAVQDAEPEDPQESILAIDNWRPRGPGGAAPHVLDRPPRRDAELEKLEDAGLVPFYWSSAHERVRHTIGGQASLKMQRQLGLIGEGNAGTADEEEDGLALVPRAGSEPEAAASVGQLWDVYPEGLSKGFLDELDQDAWPWKRAGRGRSHKRSKEKQPGAKKPAGPKKLALAPPPPVHTEERAQVRAEMREAAEAARKQAEFEAQCEELHPLLSIDNAPALVLSGVLAAAPAAAAPSSCMYPAQRSKDGPSATEEDEEPSWGFATTFCPPQPQLCENSAELKRRRRPGAGREWQPIKRLGPATPRAQPVASL